MSHLRVENDFLGEKSLEGFYGIHTARAAENFLLSKRFVRLELIHAYVIVKKACAKTNFLLGYLDELKFNAINTACNEILENKYNDCFITDALQGGAGTSTNMNVNEVIANVALKIIGANIGDYNVIDSIKHINMHQSTNDTYITALKIALLKNLQILSEDIAVLQGAFQNKEKEFASILKIARTELQDGVLMTLGMEFGAYAEAIARDRWRVFKCDERLKTVNLGATAIGIGVGAPKKYILKVVNVLRDVSGIGVARADNLVDATQNLDVFCEVSGILKAHATTLFKIASDLRLLGSGPRCGLNELVFAPRQAGSSIMAGKVNPVICEAISQAAIKVISNDLAITMCVQNGELELNAFGPLLADTILESVELLINANKMFERFISNDITVNKNVCDSYVLNSYGALYSLSGKIEYQTIEKAVLLMKEKNLNAKDALYMLLAKDKVDELFTNDISD